MTSRSDDGDVTIQHLGTFGHNQALKEHVDGIHAATRERLEATSAKLLEAHAEIRQIVQSRAYENGLQTRFSTLYHGLAALQEQVQETQREVHTRWVGTDTED